MAEVLKMTAGLRGSVATRVYSAAKQTVVALGYEKELQWQQSLRTDIFSESDLLREAAWVILCSGFRESVVRRAFGYISLCFCEWESSTAIWEFREHCRGAALVRFGNAKKIDAIIDTARILTEVGFEDFKEQVLLSPIETLRRFPYIGPITAFHLAKNLGVATAKPDRHLQRLAMYIGYEDPVELCNDIAANTGDPIQVVDLVLWRYCERLVSS